MATPLADSRTRPSVIFIWARRLNLWTFQGFHDPELTVETTRNLPV
jgi:hypothetical protein